MFHPWRLLRSRPHLRLRFADLGDEGPQGRTDGRTITLSTGLLQDERRCVVLHELLHEERGIPHGHDPREESVIEQEVARLLVGLDRLADGLRWSRHPAEVAEHCWVTVDVLWTRWAHLHPAERHYLERVVVDAHGH